MDSLNFCDARVEKAKANSKYRRFRRITALFRWVEFFVFLGIVVRFWSQLQFSVKSWEEHCRGILVNLMSPRFVFVIGNVIIAILLLKSGRSSAENGGKRADFYDEYVEKCRRNRQISGNGKLREVGVNRSRSEKVLGAAHVEESRRELRRSVTEATGGRRNAAAKGGIASYRVEDEMSGDEFRQTVEAFIARQQRLLREEEAVSDV